MTGRRLFGRLLAFLLVGAALAFLGVTIARNFGAVRAFDWNVDPIRLVASLAAHILVLGWGVVVWHQVMRHTTERTADLTSLLRIWFVSAVARYIPGKIWQFVAAAQLAVRAELSAAAVLTSMAIQVGFTLLAAVIVSVAVLPLPDAWPLGRAATLVVALLGAVLLSHPAVLRAALRLIPRALHRDVLAWRGGWADGAVLLALSIISWCLYGAAFHLFVSALVPVPLQAMPMMAGVNALSFLAGYLVLIAPAGLGAREFAMWTLLQAVVPSYIAAVVAALSRLWTIAAELIGAAAAWWMGPSRRAGAKAPRVSADVPDAE